MNLSVPFPTPPLQFVVAKPSVFFGEGEREKTFGENVQANGDIVRDHVRHRMQKRGEGMDFTPRGEEPTGSHAVPDSRGGRERETTAKGCFLSFPEPSFSLQNLYIYE